MHPTTRRPGITASSRQDHGPVASLLNQKDNVDLDAMDDGHGHPRHPLNMLVEFTRNDAPAGLNTGNWRGGKGLTRNVFVRRKLASDDAACAAGRDPSPSRKSSDEKRPPRARAALERGEKPTIAMGKRVARTSGREESRHSGLSAKSSGDRRESEREMGAEEGSPSRSQSRAIDAGIVVTPTSSAPRSKAA